MDTSELIQPHTPLDYTKESIKLVKNSKGYTWEIKVISTDITNIFSDADMKRLNDLNEKMKGEYSNENS